MSDVRVFDEDHYQNLNSSRAVLLTQLLSKFREQIDLRTALDVGCGLGYFSEYLHSLGFQVTSVDGREENIVEARRRHPGVVFVTQNAEDLPVERMGTFDLVLCFGLFYHLENPFRMIRSLQKLTGAILLLEGMCVPSKQAVMYLLDEPTSHDQGFDNVAFYPSESCLVKMLYRAGFPFVYELDRLPSDERYTSTALRKRLRTFIVASKVKLTAENLNHAEEPTELAYEFGPWATPLSRLRDSGAAGRILVSAGIRLPRFLSRPWAEKRAIVSWYLRRFWNRVSVSGTRRT